MVGNKLLGLWKICFFAFLPTTLTEYMTVTRCDIGPASVENAAEITCDFPWDLNQTHQSFTVNRYARHVAEKVLVCHWYGAQILCIKKEGVGEPDTVSYQFNITIPIQDNTEFGCDVFPSDITTEIRRCRYALRREFPSTVSAPPATVHTEEKDDEHSSKCDMAVGFMVVSVILLLLYIALISLWVLHRLLAKRRNCKMEEPSPLHCEPIWMDSPHTEETTSSINETRTTNPVLVQKATEEWSEVTKFCIKARGESSSHGEKKSEVLDDGATSDLEELVKVNEKLDSANTLLLLRIRFEEQSDDGKTTSRYMEIACSKTKGWILVRSNTGSVKYVRVSGVQPVTAPEDITQHQLNGSAQKNAVGAGPYVNKDACGPHFEEKYSDQERSPRLIRGQDAAESPAPPPTPLDAS